jgi:hypothetical protein
MISWIVCRRTALVGPSPVVEIVGRRAAADALPTFLEAHVVAPVVSGLVCTMALLLCVLMAISRRWVGVLTKNWVGVG